MQVGTNGIISLGQPWTFWNPDLFPTDDYYIHISYVYAPFWADIDTRLAGSVYYETHQRGINDATNAVLERVSGFIASKMGISFSALWMIVAQWDRVHPFPHGSTVSAVSDQYSLFLNSVSIYTISYIVKMCVKKAIMYPCVRIHFSPTGEHVSSHSHHRWNAKLCHIHLPMWSNTVVWRRFRILCNHWVQSEWCL